MSNINWAENYSSFVASLSNVNDQTELQEIFNKIIDATEGDPVELQKAWPYLAAIDEAGKAL